MPPTKANKICNAFNANQYPFPNSHDDQMKMYSETQARLADLERVMATTSRQRAETLSEIAATLPLWSEKVRRGAAEAATAFMTASENAPSAP